MSQKTDKMLKLALVFFISLLSFSIGTFVGKKYSDNQHKLATLEPHANSEGNPQEFATGDEKHEGTTEELATTAKKGDVALTDHEVAKIAEEFATDSNEVDTSTEKTIKTADSEEKDIKEITVVNAPKKAMPAIKPTVMKHEESAVAAVQPAAPRPLPAARATTAAPAARAVASIPPTANQYTVQVGSFATAPEAQKLAKELMDKGFKTSYAPADVNGKTWYRVQVGIFGSVQEAQDYKKDFLEKTRLTSAIVQRVQR